MRLETTGPLSNSEQVRWARLAATPTASPHGPAPITATSCISAAPARTRVGARRSRHFDDLVPAGADAHVLNRRVGQVLESIEVRPGRRREVGQPPHLIEGFLPPGKGLVHGLHAGEPLDLCRHAVERLAVEPVADAHRDVGERVEHVQLRDGEAREAADPHRVEPPAAPRPAGRGPELVAQSANPLGDLRLRLGRERPVPHPRRVGFHDAQHGIDRGGADPRPDRGPAGRGVGRRHEGIRSMIDVEQGALRPFEEHRLPALQRLVNDPPHVHGERQEPRREPFEQPDMLLRVGALARVQELEELVRGLHARTDEFARPREIAEVADPNPAAAVLVLVGGPDAAPGRADLVALLARPVEQLVVRQCEMRAVRDIELVVGANAPGREGVELGEERLRVEDDAIPDQADGALDDPRWDLVQHELAGARVHRVSGVRPALIAHHQVGALGEHVHDLPLALVAPLGADDDGAVYLRSEHVAPTKTPRGAGRASILRRKLGRRPGSVNAPVRHAPVRHAQTSLATRSRSAGASGASGARHAPPYSPTASMAALTPAGPSFPTISLSSGTSRSCKAPARARSPARKAATMSAHRRAAKHATATMPPSHPSSSAVYKSEPDPASTDQPGAAPRKAARLLASPEESFTPTMFACPASCSSSPGAMARCVYLGML